MEGDHKSKTFFLRFYQMVDSTKSTGLKQTKVGTSSLEENCQTLGVKNGFCASNPSIVYIDWGPFV